MKTIFAVLMMFVSLNVFANSFYSYNASVNKENNSVVLKITNNVEEYIYCKYEVTWAEGLSYKEYSGSMIIETLSAGEVVIKNDRYAKIRSLTAVVSCE